MRARKQLELLPLSPFWLKIYSFFFSFSFSPSAFPLFHFHFQGYHFLSRLVEMFLVGGWDQGVKGEKRDGWGATKESTGNYLRAFGEEDVVSVYMASFFLSSLAPFWPLKHSICFSSLCCFFHAICRNVETCTKGTKTK